MRNTTITQLCILCIAAVGCEIDDPYGPIEDRDADLIDESPDSPGDEPGLEADIKPFATTYQPGIIGQDHLKCCNGAVNCTTPTGSYPGTCSGGKVLTACYGCDFDNPGDTCSSDFLSGEWTYMGPTGYFCNGFAWIYINGVLAYDRCSQDGCVPVSDGGVCNASEGDYSPNGCPDFTAASVYTFDGAIGRMCCRTNANSPSGYSCIPRGAGESCSGLNPHTISSYCMPCDGNLSWTDPDGSGTNNTGGAWDLYGPSGNEAPGSVYCGDGSDDMYYDPNFGADCKKVEYICRGTQVNSGTGSIQNSEC